MSVLDYQDASKEELQELENERLELLNDFKEQLAVFCDYLKVDLDQQATLKSLDTATALTLSSPRYIPAQKGILKISAQGYLSIKLVEKVKSTTTDIVKALAKKIADSSQKLPCNDIALKGSVDSIAAKLTQRYLFGHRRFYDVEPIPEVPTLRNDLRALCERHLLDRVKERYTSHYHRYRLWDGRAIDLFSSYLFNVKSEEHSFFDSKNLIHLLNNTPAPIKKEWFKDECIECWEALYADGPRYAYTELAYPDESGVIFEEYVPLDMVSEDVWDSLYERYKNKLKEHVEFAQ
ncbi:MULTISPECIES: hypothetical protein [Vibrio]|uniref:Uncharacterized protein n=1 Tax=Vibrio kanaloae TaxID=170673 RepID=A0ABV4LCV0_9VIBR|nr:hypothetical protein [Vibrio kanaloae]OEF15675.1 hypothetical protein A132_17640 [Vibrio kanaloae 5S-149]